MRTKTMTGLQRLRVESVHIEMTRFLIFAVEAEDLDEIQMLKRLLGTLSEYD